MSLPYSKTILRGLVVKMGVGLTPVTCEVAANNGQQITIWFKGHRLGQTVDLEQRQSESGPYWAEVGVY